MLTLRGWAMLLAIGALLQPAAAAQPEHVTYAVGGLMSGPFRLEGDLVTGDFSEARPTPGKFGSAAGLDADTMPVTGRWTVPPRKLAVLRRLAAKIWRRGMETGITTIIHHRAGHVPDIRMIDACQPSADALGGLILEQGGRKRRFDFSMTCVSKEGQAFLDALFAAR